MVLNLNSLKANGLYVCVSWFIGTNLLDLRFQILLCVRAYIYIKIGGFTSILTRKLLCSSKIMDHKCHKFVNQSMWV